MPIHKIVLYCLLFILIFASLIKPYPQRFIVSIVYRHNYLL